VPMLRYFVSLTTRMLWFDRDTHVRGLLHSIEGGFDSFTQC